VTTEINIPAHGGQLRQLAERFGVSVSELLDFSANINPEGPPASVLQAMKRALNDPTTLSRYPDLDERELRLSIAQYAGVAPESVAVGNGFVPLLDAVLATLRIRSCLLPVPSFGEYRDALLRSDVAVTPYVLDREAEFRYQPDHLLEVLANNRHDSILLANPQNPTGVHSNRNQLLSFIERAAELNIWVLVDEAFIDYVPNDSVGSEVESFRNLIVFRSVTKFHGIPGLRVAYSVANNEMNGSIRRHLPPWSITTLAAIGVRAALADTAYSARALQVNLERRMKLAANLTELGLHSYRAAANFLLIRFRSSEESLNCWEGLILNHSIVLRNCRNFEGLIDDHLRCAVRDDNQNAQLVEALKLQLKLN
jgi:threonine-phosphate decarboxylase